MAMKCHTLGSCVATEHRDPQLTGLTFLVDTLHQQPGVEEACRDVRYGKGRNGRGGEEDNVVACCTNLACVS